jgi:predicted acetyltransferase
VTPFPIRAVGDDEAERLAFARAVSRHFFEDEPDDELRLWLPVLEDTRSFVATDGDRVVGNWGAFQVDLSVPGGTLLPCSGVTAVGVSQTHRRRGLLRNLMTVGLDDAVERGQPVAALYASESAIYPRFGFGVTAPTLGYRIDSTDLRFRDPVDPALVVDLDADDTVAEVQVVYELVRNRRGGGVGRLPGQWELSLITDLASSRDGASSKRRIHVPGRGYAIYRVRDGAEDVLPNGEVVLLELVAADPEAEQALWQHLASVDLTTSIRAWHRPTDDALPLQVEDRLRLRATAGPPMYTRILDVLRCLGSRVSGVSGGLVLEVHDADRDQSGTYRWDVSPEGSACSRDRRGGRRGDVHRDARRLLARRHLGVPAASRSAPRGTHARRGRTSRPDGRRAPGALDTVGVLSRDGSFVRGPIGAVVPLRWPAPDPEEASCGQRLQEDRTGGFLPRRRGRRHPRGGPEGQRVRPQPRLVRGQGDPRLDQGRRGAALPGHHRRRLPARGRAGRLTRGA